MVCTRVVVCFALLFALDSIRARVAAEDADAFARSNQLFDTAKRLMAEGHVRPACAAFAESYRLVPRGGTLLNLGMCHAQAEEWLRARREIAEAVVVAEREQRAERLRIAREHLARVEAMLSRVFIVVLDDAPPDGLSVEVDGTSTTGSADPIYVEAGEHTARATAPGFAAQSVRVQTQPGESVVVRISKLTPLTQVTAAQPAATTKTDGARGRDAWRRQRAILLVAGSVLATAGIVAGALALRAKREVRDQCDGDACSRAGMRAVRRGQAATWTSNVSFGLGAAVLLTPLVLPGGPLRRGARDAVGWGSAVSASF